jgi:sec-independent protein translocase protein TatB
MNFGMSEMIFIFIAALILVGPKKLPEIMRQVGKFMNEFKRASNEFKYQIESEINNLELETKKAKQQVLPPAPMPVTPPPQGTIASGSMLEAKPSALEAITTESSNGASHGASGDAVSPIATADPVKSLDA